MTPAFSTYLDAMRFLAALVVVVSHLAYERFTDGRLLLVRDYNLGSDAVIIFFVLSGYVIALTAAEKDRALGRFAFTRATRLYPVAIPALLLGFFLDRLGAAHDPAGYEGWWYSPVPLGEFLAYGLTFSNEWIFGGIRLGTNGPYWSLSYEVAYYALFAVAVFLTGMRRVVCLVAICLLAGLNVLLLAPAWLAGVLLYKQLHRPQPTTTPRNAYPLIILPPLFYILAQATGLPMVLETLTNAVVVSVGGEGLRFSNEFIWNSITAALFATHLTGMHQALSERKTASKRLGKTVRWLAGATFSLYLVHYPLRQFLHSILPVQETAALDYAVLFTTTVVLCFVFAQLFERPLPAIRRGLRAAWRKLGTSAVA